MLNITTIKTTPYQDQKCGTSGLRKKVTVFKQQNYLENFIQSIFNALEGFEGKTLVVGGDGRYFNNQAIQSVIKIAIANQFGRLVIGQNGILSTPAASHLITLKNAFGGIILSASHNPGGPNGDFGIKFDTNQGAPAPQVITDKITEQAKVIDHYWWANMPDVDLSVIGEQTIGTCVIEVVDSVKDYADYMQEIFDFNAIRNLFKNGFKMTYDALNAVTGPYASYIFEELLGAEVGSVVNKTPLADFGGFHPEPNLHHARHLVEQMNQPDAPDFAAASDGDGDRYMILGRHFFMAPSDSLAIIAQYMETLPFYQGRFYGVARSIPTADAVDFVLKDKGLNVYATPTGWKFFASLLDAHKISLCGEESFGTGSFHLCEKDGIWAILFWLHILALTGKTLQEVAQELWVKYGRVFASTHNYENLEKETADALLANLAQKIPTLAGSNILGQQIISAQEFNYEDPVTGDKALKQGYEIILEKGRVFARLSGTGSSGATLRVYYMYHEQDPQFFNQDIQEALAPVIRFGEEVLEIKKFTAREGADIIT